MRKQATHEHVLVFACSMQWRFLLSFQETSWSRYDSNNDYNSQIYNKQSDHAVSSEGGPLSCDSYRIIFQVGLGGRGGVQANICNNICARNVSICDLYVCVFSTWNDVAFCDELCTCTQTFDVRTSKYTCAVMCLVTCVWSVLECGLCWLSWLVGCELNCPLRLRCALSLCFRYVHILLCAVCISVRKSCM